jgi:hypothetical protein
MIRPLVRGKWPLVATGALLVVLSCLPGCGESTPSGADKAGPTVKQVDLSSTSKRGGGQGLRSIKNRPQPPSTP